MYQERVTLCVANAYEQKYYFNPDFETLPSSVKDELKIMCVLFTEDVGGILSLVFEGDGHLSMEVSAMDGDGLYDDIGSGLKIREIQRTKTELLESLELFYKIFFMDADLDEENWER